MNVNYFYWPLDGAYHLGLHSFRNYSQDGAFSKKWYVNPVVQVKYKLKNINGNYGLTTP